jgi:diguanylate cyclase (GGDEF)-like protein
LGSICPFNIVFNKHGEIVQVGDALHLAIPELSTGKHLNQHFCILSPQVQLKFDAIKKLTNSLFIMRSLDNGMQIEGYMVYVEENDVIFFFGSPPLADYKDQNRLESSLHDGAVQDSVVDYILLLQAQYVALAEAKNLPKNFNMQRLNLGDAGSKPEMAASDVKAIFQAFPELYFRMQADGTIVDYHAETSSKRYDSPRGFLGKNIRDVLPAGVAQQFQQAVVQSLSANSLVAIEYFLELPKGKKSFEARLLPLPERQVIVIIRDVTERQQAEEKIRYQALHDLLTGLPNRMLFNERLSISLASASQLGGMLAVCFLDLDRFKTINDTLGHKAGDRLLQCVAQRLAGCLREGDTVARWGGDEFIVLLSHINCKDDAAKIAQRILEAFKPSFDLDGHQLHISSSIGISVSPYDGEEGETLIKNADAALYRAKQQGRNNYQLYTKALNSKAEELLTLENRLHRALEQGEFLVHYQPQVNTSTGEIIQLEALVRWQHPDIGLVSPATFIPLAEETGLIVPIGEWVLKTACAQNKAWHDAGLPPVCVAVNLSARQFQQPNLVEMVGRILSETGLDPRFLELEITESSVMGNMDFSRAMLRDLHNMGVGISMDDFGTGYSSLLYIKNFPLHGLKIDQSFVRDLTTDPNNAAIVTAVIALGHGLNLSVVAEGVETEEQKDFLRSLQCEVMQGYLFSRPLSVSDATKLLQKSCIKALKAS